MNKKKLLLLLTIISLLFIMSGCSTPTDADGKIIQITDDTTFQYMMDNEGIFSAILVFPLAKTINYLVPRTNVVVAIIIVSVLINAIILLFTWKQNVFQQKMQLIQSDVARIQKKYEGRDDQASRMKMAQEMQNLYTKAGINPLGSLVASFIQFPFLIAMYHAVIRSSAVANGSFLNVDLSLTPMNALRSGQFGQVVIFILMILAQIAAMKVPQWLSEKRAKAEAEKHYRKYNKPEANPSMTMMTYFMPVFIGVIMLNWPTAMSLYYLISSLVMIGKNFLIDTIIQRKGI